MVRPRQDHRSRAEHRAAPGEQQHPEAAVRSDRRADLNRKSRQLFRLYRRGTVKRQRDPSREEKAPGEAPRTASRVPPRPQGPLLQRQGKTGPTGTL
ncbi:hypothetical protein NDU88_003367 [Pleurodeles waltl]|uniref:Uncharacterized protein n=1 Tax=Pleurodeles waltl TaxID=8319 RepID=A0AAV7RFP0_PLEWA|nr:hypothetical protein NDU88_003367 [Pleurodeles waltl]